MKRIFQNKAVTIVLMVIAALWFLRAGISLAYPNRPLFESLPLQWLRALLTPVSLSLFRFEAAYRAGVNLISYIDIVFYALLLTGALVSISTKYRETRLLEFGLACTVFFRSLVLLNAAIIFIRSAAHLAGEQVFYTLLFSVISVAWAAFSWFALKALRGQAALCEEQMTGPRGAGTYFVQANRWQRLAHYVVDLTLCLMLCVRVIFSVAGSGRLDDVEHVLGSRLTTYLVFLPAILLYYLFFESLFGVTPGKLLTGVRVATHGGARPAFGAITIRTLSRLVPFEAFSTFVYPWHDTWSDTVVLKEARKVINPRRYLLLLPYIIFLGAAPVLGLSAWERYKDHQALQRRADDNQAAKMAALAHLNNTYFIHLVNAEHEYDGTADRYLRVESADNSGIRASVILPKQSYLSPHSKVRELYESQQGRSGMKNINLADLRRAVPTEAFNRDAPDRKAGVDLLGNGQLYRVDWVEGLYGVWVESNGSSFYGSGERRRNDDRHSFTYSFKNNGISGRLVAIKSANKTVVWTTALPLQIHAQEPRSYSSFSVSGCYTGSDPSFEARLVFVSERGDSTEFLFKGGEDKDYGLWPVFERPK